MCFYFQMSKSAQEVQHRFKTKKNEASACTSGMYNGFAHPKTMVITHHATDTLQCFEWGLIPHWAKDDTIQKNTLNARIETVHEKPSFRKAASNRCIIPADGFFEWQWLDPKGKSKQRYQLHISDDQLFAFAGIWSTWVDVQTGEIRNTYSILTTAAQGLMEEIHNSKKRMPVILQPEFEMEWLEHGKISSYHEALQALAL